VAAISLRDLDDGVKERLRVHVLPFDARAAREYADVVVGRERTGRPVDGVDAQVASLCRARAAAVATRIRDFRDVGIEVLDPWRTD
jgi:toxin FitB